MTAPYRKPGECLPDRPLPPAVILPKPKGRGVWVNMLRGRGRDLGALRRRYGLVEVLIGIAAVAVLAAIVAFALTADLKDLEPGCSCSCSPQPCSCSCDGPHGLSRRNSLWDD